MSMGPTLHRSGAGDRALLFVHGFLDDHLTWEPLLDELAAPGFERVRIDLAGMGARSGEPGPYTLERHADDLVVAIQAIDEPVVLVGQSMGAQVAELAASRCASRVKGLVLITPVPLAGTHLPADMLANFKPAGDASQPTGEARRPLMVTVTARMIDGFTRSSATIDPRVLPQLVDAWDGGHEAGLATSGFPNPVLVMPGAGDGFISAEVIAQAVVPRFSRVQVSVIERSGHWPHVEQPASVAASLDAFLAALPS